MKAVRTILHPTDFTDDCARAMRLAVAMCQRTGARLVIHHNVTPSATGPVSRYQSSTGAEVPREVAGRLEALRETIPSTVATAVELSSGPKPKAVLALADEVEADLIVMASHGRSTVTEASITEKVVRRAACPVLTIGEACHVVTLAHEPLRVLAAIDLGPRTQMTLDHTVALSKVLPLDVHLIHALKPKRGLAKAEQRKRQAVQEVSAVIPAELSELTKTHVLTGEPAELLSSHAGEIGADLVIIAAHDKGFLSSQLFGSVTLETLHACPCPVWFVPDKESATAESVKAS
jgi:nucleotide-binding universal stress UspA family protein